MKKLKILEVAAFSAGICGVWTRVREEAQILAEKGHEVMVFSSNIEKGTDRIVCSEENIHRINIQRFSAKRLGGESFMNWNFKKEALQYSPDIILAHSYRQLHTTKALKIAKILKKQGKKCKIFLITHAPFERNESRTKIQRFIIYLYDKLITQVTLNKFDKIIAITKWEIPYLLDLGVKKEKIVYIPNGIPEEFFEIKSQSKEKNILFLGRIAPIKNLQVLIKSLKYTKDKEIKIEIVGPAEAIYLKSLRELIEENKLQDRIIFSKPIYSLKEKIKKIDSAKIFVLPSKSEGMPQSLIEAMARGKICIGSDILAVRDLIKDNKNGFIFGPNNEKDLAKKIDLALSKDNKEIKKEAKNSVKNFNWKEIIKKLISLF